MKRLFLLVISSMLVLAGQAQQMDKELSSLLSLVKMLRDGSSVSYNKVEASLKADSKWTPMNEPKVAQGQECKAAEIGSRFKLNRILSQVDKGRKYVDTHGRMLNGEDERYNYSLYEHYIAAKSTIKYTLKGREGRQTFVIVPYKKSGSGLTATISFPGGTQGKFQQQADGTLFYAGGDSSVERNDVITITVTSSNASNQAFVLLNHNSRNK